MTRINYMYARANKATLVLFVINNGLLFCSGTSFLVKQDSPRTGFDYIFYLTIYGRYNG